MSNKERLYRDLCELEDKALQMIEMKEFTSAHKIHKQIQRIKKLIKQEK